jgi:hypothetical protein
MTMKGSRYRDSMAAPAARAANSSDSQRQLISV